MRQSLLIFNKGEVRNARTKSGGCNSLLTSVIIEADQKRPERFSPTIAFWLQSVVITERERSTSANPRNNSGGCGTEGLPRQYSMILWWSTDQTTDKKTNREKKNKINSVMSRRKVRESTNTLTKTSHKCWVICNHCKHKSEQNS